MQAAASAACAYHLLCFRCHLKHHFFGVFIDPTENQLTHTTHYQHFDAVMVRIAYKCIFPKLHLLLLLLLNGNRSVRLGRSVMIEHDVESFHARYTQIMATATRKKNNNVHIQPFELKNNATFMRTNKFKAVCQRKESTLLDALATCQSNRQTYP